MFITIICFRAITVYEQYQECIIPLLRIYAHLYARRVMDLIWFSLCVVLFNAKPKSLYVFGIPQLLVGGHCLRLDLVDLCCVCCSTESSYAIAISLSPRNRFSYSCISVLTYSNILIIQCLFNYMFSMISCLEMMPICRY